ncbi:hypothetical protein QEG73_02085 [Chitinophagaceae bacterium 26-R-25]|nr:hypothetical protein [Chitinophagaceae bacterium 26-R-25]
MKRRLFLFRVIAIAIPFGILLVLELALRLFNYGYDYRLFVEDKQNRDYWVMNQDASKKYFPDQTIATTGNKEPFKKEKNPNTIRIFVLGESTTIGYPYFHNGSFHRMLFYRLMHSMPDKNFEIVNVSLTAVNSYTILDFARQVVDQQPDAVLIFTGHNEYYGALGVGSTQQLGTSRGLVKTILYLRQLKITQLLTNAWLHLRSLGGKGNSEKKDRMELMAKDQNIAYVSAQFNAGVDQFQKNMEETLQLFQDHDVPVYLSTVVSNEKDLTPFVSEKPADNKQKNFDDAFHEGMNALTIGDLPQASINLKKADSIFSRSAICNYQLGRTFLQLGQTDSARAYFTKAVDLDMLRFRAPSAINKTIRLLSGKYHNTILVDAEAAFQHYAAHQVIGNDLILEHVHPNITGYALLSQSFYEAMKKKGFLKVQEGNEMSFDELIHRMPVTKPDSLAGYYKVFNLKRMWPFAARNPSKKDTLSVVSQEEQLAYAMAFDHKSWETTQSELYAYYISNSDSASAKKVIEGLLLEHPLDTELYEMAGNICGQLHDYKYALSYFKRSFQLQPSVSKAKTILVLLLQEDMPADAIPYIDYAIHNTTSGYDYTSLKKTTAAIVQLKTLADKTPGDFALLNNIATQYYTMGNKSCAEKYVKRVLQLAPSNKDALLLNTRLKQRG